MLSEILNLEIRFPNLEFCFPDLQIAFLNLECDALGFRKPLPDPGKIWGAEAHHGRVPKMPSGVFSSWRPSFLSAVGSEQILVFPSPR